MSGRTFTALTGSGSADSYDVGDKFGFQTAEKIRQNDDLLAYIGDALFLGGHPGIGHVTGAATWEVVDPGLVFTLDGDNLGGLTLEVVFTTKTENASQAVQARLRNVTDSSTAATSASHSSTTATVETVTATLVSGAKQYRLEVLGGATYAVFASAYLRIRKVPS